MSFLPRPEPDGHCNRCGLLWEDRLDTLDPHECPPGFLSPSITRVRALEAVAGELLEALQDLVELKDSKDKHGKTEFYETFQPMAWDKARAAIAKATGDEK